MRMKCKELDDMYATVHEHVQGLEDGARKRFEKRIERGHEALKRLEGLVVDSGSRSGMSGLKLLLRRAIFYLFGQKTLASACKKMHRILRTLQRHEERLVLA